MVRFATTQLRAVRIAKLALQLPNLRTQHLLRDTNPLGRPREVQLLSYSQEVA
jgi:hypothetical protein